jgi:hypothetical protein
MHLNEFNCAEAKLSGWFIRLLASVVVGKKNSTVTVLSGSVKFGVRLGEE